MKYTYLIEGLAPLVFRSGKPFGAQAGADGAAFPPPSSLAGLLRTLSADQSGETFTDQLKAIATAGPLLAWRDRGGKLTPLLPRPADALYLRDEDDLVQVLRLALGPLPAGCGCDLDERLLPVQMERPLRGKPVAGPQYWPLDALESWLAGENLTFAKLQESGLSTLQAEERTHVALDDTTLASDAGRLFQTGGIDLAPLRVDAGWAERDLVFLARTERLLDPTLATFGGERRLSRLRPAGGWPCPAANLEEQIGSAAGLKLTLTTPAIFKAGHLPGWLDATSLTGSPPSCPDLKLRLRAAAVERWLPLSGWDLKENKARAMRKAVAAGSVYWFEIQEEAPAGFLDKFWLTPISDHPQDRLDGFGLAIPAPWQPV